MTHKLLDKFQILYDKQDILSTLTDNELFEDMSNSEVHCLVAIQDLDYPNTTQLSDFMNMTPGAISKIIKKLKSKDFIVITQKEDNKKEKYFSLTTAGSNIYKRHERAHHDWLLRDQKFLDSKSESDLAVVASFLEDFNHYLDTIIKEKTNDI